jgi:hypothetical protein
MLVQGQFASSGIAGGVDFHPSEHEKHLDQRSEGIRCADLRRQAGFGAQCNCDTGRDCVREIQKDGLCRRGCYPAQALGKVRLRARQEGALPPLGLWPIHPRSI